MKQIRNSVFETNSSSSHSLIVDKNHKYCPVLPDYDGVLRIKSTVEGFWWGPHHHHDYGTKAYYLRINSNQHNVDLLEDLLLEYTGASSIEWPKQVQKIEEKGGLNEYIDHQSVGFGNQVFENIDILKNFLFNPESILQIDNDNSRHYEYWF